MKVFLFSFLSITISLSLSGQYVSGVTLPAGNKVNYDSLRFHDKEASLAATIRSSDLKEYLTVLASDEMGGRELGTEGNAKAGAYIADKLQSMGIPPYSTEDGYYQKVAFSYTKWENIDLYVNEKEYSHLKDFISFPLMNNSSDEMLVDEDIYFLGYGIKTEGYNDYRKENLARGKTILIYRGEPRDDNGVSHITGTKKPSEWSTDITKKLQLAQEMGVKQVLIIDDSLKQRIADNRRQLLRAQMTLGEAKDNAHLANSFFISTNVLEDILGKKYKKFVKKRDKIKSKGKSYPFKIRSEIRTRQEIDQRTVYGNNVLGYIEGIDPELKDEVLIISAHYDHIGRRGDDINNGADDNGSGTSSVLEIAEAYARAKEIGEGPRRSVLCLFVTGEEKGLLGSEYYSENPIFPIENSIANINIDMVGRVHEKYASNPHYIYVIGSDRLSSQLHVINEQKNEEYVNLTLDYKYNSESDPNRFYFRSDHYNFAKKGIPAIFFFNGTHPDYHRPTDTVEKINFEKMESVARHIFHLSWELVNRDNRIMVDGK